MSIGEDSGFLDTAGNGGEQARELETEASRFRSAASRAVKNSKAVAQRWGRQTRDVAANATDRIKDDPLRSAAITFVIGLALGALVGRWSGRQRQCD
jgi:ElaB/YqjD/DUF883 family membrane-anchored ribosome-binding protein